MSRTQHARPHPLKRPPMCKHHRPSKLKGKAWASYQRERAERGPQVQQCPTCRFFFWPDEMGVKP